MSKQSVDVTTICDHISPSGARLMAALGKDWVTNAQLSTRSRVGGSSHNLTAYVGALNPDVRAKWEAGRTRSSGYWATYPKSPLGGRSLIGLGLVEAQHRTISGKRKLCYRLTALGKQVKDELSKRADS